MAGSPPVAKFTAAVTSSKAESFFSTRAAHAAHVIPLTASSTSRHPGNDARPVIAADIQPFLLAEPRDRGEYRCTGKSTPRQKCQQRKGCTLT
jgi:hypothetical protein